MADVTQRLQNSVTVTLLRELKQDRQMMYEQKEVLELKIITQMKNSLGKKKITRAGDLAQ